MKDWINWLVCEWRAMLWMPANSVSGKHRKFTAFVNRQGLMLYPQGLKRQPMTLEEFQKSSGGGSSKPKSVTLLFDSPLGLERQVAPIVLPIRQIRRMAELDIKLSTPLNLADVLLFLPEPTEMRNQSNYVAMKTTLLLDSIVKLRTSGLKPSRLAVAGVTGTFFADATILKQLALLPKGRSFLDRIATMAIIFLFLGGVATLAHVHVRNTNSLADLDSNIAKQKKRAHEIRNKLTQRENRIKQLELLRNKTLARAPVISIVEELTKIIPDSAWLTDLEIFESDIKMSGFAKSSSSLVATVDKSPFFKTPSLSGRVLRDPDTGADRFSIKMRLESKGE